MEGFQNEPKIPDISPENSENKISEEKKVPEMDIEKGWKEQLAPEQIEKIKNWAERVVKQWHDEIQPDYIFLTETGAIPYGYVLKETWKNAYTEEENPRFYRIVPKNHRLWWTNYEPVNKTEIKKTKDQNLKEILKQEARDIPEALDYIGQRIDKDNPVIMVFDEGSIADNVRWPNEKEEATFKKRFFEFNGKHVSKIDDVYLSCSNSLQNTMRFLSRILKDKNPKIYGFQQAIKEILIGTKEHPDNKKISTIKSRLPTSKHYSDITVETSTQTEDQKRYLKDKMIGSIVKHPEQRKRALGYVNDLKEIGEEAGKELHENLEKEKTETEPNTNTENKSSES
ncbi:MAG: hypothetical protein AAB446_00940 [Patescibacteria group bacterium]